MAAQVKICGLTEIEQAIVAAEAGADYLGLVFASSRRQVIPEKAAEVANAIHRIKTPASLVGVFVNSPVQEVNRTADMFNLDWVQLSGAETWEYCLGIKKPIIKAIHISAGDSVSDVICYLKEGYSVRPKDRLMYLLDTHVEGAYGGTGIKFNWRLAEKIAAEFPVIVAGGLTPENVGQLISTVKPWGVDVSSGVETSGKKDIYKIKEFIRRAKTQE
jgi:phosphoribosylanthranilate isomerase